ncbi:MAG TPA: hypothetical protein PLR20_03135 [Syntrophales bacterium]|nr:hypothetical protein [Syntrophales bacterium]HOX93395.1 hypothetical protein [Syntrophales bacterium]HPI56060.1 hypothetical protein [Syntrophales bacterium]HPN24050.1 hypothetical protein [Syntrophales bacterium]HQM28329.1 hypothetical protein [Syntrophales bacterium]
MIRKAGPLSLLCFSLALFLTPLACNPSPSHSKAAVAFKKEVRDNIEKLSPPFAEALHKGDHKALESALTRACIEAEEQGKPFSCGIAILDKNGVSMTSTSPRKPSRGIDYSHYESITKTLREKRIVRVRLFLQDGTKIYAVSSPLMRDGRLVGLLVLGYFSTEVQRNWGLTEAEFLELDFNR